MPLTSPRRSALSDQVIAALRAQITSGEWPVGARIPTEPELVEQLGVARNTVREAVRALAHNGLLDIRQGSGTYVVATSELAGVMHRRFADADPRHVAELRAALETSARPAGGASGAPSRTCRQLDALLVRREAAWESGDAEALRDGRRDLPPGGGGRLPQRRADRGVRRPGEVLRDLLRRDVGEELRPEDAHGPRASGRRRSARATREAATAREAGSHTADCAAGAVRSC